MAKPIPVAVARNVAETYDYDQLVIIARICGENGLEHVTTYGRGKDHCAAAARIGDFLKRAFKEQTTTDWGRGDFRDVDNCPPHDATLKGK